MLTDSPAFNGFSVNDIEAAKQFYGETLGIKIRTEGDMGFSLIFPTGGTTFVYPKPDHQPATFTILNFPVEDIDEAHNQLADRGVVFEHYEGMQQDEKGIVRANENGPNIAWFKDPAGNVLSIINEG